LSLIFADTVDEIYMGYFRGAPFIIFVYII
jgi:hypothetical protein